MLKASKYLLSCYQRLGKFNAIVCKISQPSVNYLIYTSQRSDVTRVFIPVRDFSLPGIGNGKMSFPGIPGMQGVTQWVVRALSFHCVDAANALHAFVQPFRRTVSRLQDGRAQHSFFLSENVPVFSLRKCSQILPFLYSTNSAVFIRNIQ